MIGFESEHPNTDVLAAAAVVTLGLCLVWSRRRSRNKPQLTWIPQAHVNGCGDACVQMIQRAHGCVIANLAEIRRAIGAGSGALQVRQVVDGLSHFGFPSEPMLCCFESLRKVPLPCILGLNSKDNSQDAPGHFVVLCQINRNAVRIADPAAGVQKWSREKLEAAWTGIVIVAEPTKDLPVPNRTLVPGRTPAQSLFRLARPDTAQLLWSLAATTGHVLMILLFFMVMQSLVAALVANHDHKLVRCLIAGIALVTALSVLFRQASRRVSAAACQSLAERIESKLTQRAMALDATNARGVNALIAAHVPRLREAADFIFQAASAAVQLVALLGWLWIVAPALSTTVAASLAGIFVALRCLEPRIRKQTIEEHRAGRQLVLSRAAAACTARHSAAAPHGATDESVDVQRIESSRATREKQRGRQQLELVAQFGAVMATTATLLVGFAQLQAGLITAGHVLIAFIAVKWTADMCCSLAVRSVSMHEAAWSAHRLLVQISRLETTSTARPSNAHEITCSTPLAPLGRGVPTGMRLKGGPR